MTTQSISFVFAAFLLAVVLSFSSCSEDEGGVSASGKASLLINVAGISAGGEESLTRAALEPETVVLTADDGTPVEFTLSVDPASLTRTTTAMATNNVYRVIVYKSDGTYVKEAVCTAGFASSITELEQDTPYKLVAISYNTTTVPTAVGSGTTTITVDPPTDLLHWVSSSPVTIASGSPSPTVDITFYHRFPKVTVTVDASLTGNNIIAVPASATLEPGKKSQLTLLTDGAPTVTEGTISAQTFTLSTINAQTSPGSSRYVFTGTDNSVTVTFDDGNLTVAAPSGNRTLTSPVVVHFNSVLESGYSYTLTMRVEASKGDYYPYADKTGSNYEVVIPINETDLGSPYYGESSLTFLRYNLGADPDLNPKQQMAYPHTDAKNIRVYGGLFQWGRKDVLHALRDANSGLASAYFRNTQYSNTYNPATDTMFVYGNFDWFHSSNIKSFWDGKELAEQISISKGLSDPCPTGYRVPIQHEWALILNEGGSSKNITNDYFNSGGSNTDRHGTTWYVPFSNTNVVWVRVSNKHPSTTFQSGMMNGYALYSFFDLGILANNDLNEKFDPDVDLTTINDNPLMFLPAAGYRNRNTSEVGNVDTYGYYWCTTNKSDNSYDMYFNQSEMNIQKDTYRTFGMSVRCIKE